MLTDHPCHVPHPAVLKPTRGQKKADIAGRLLIDGHWYCTEHAPKTIHRNCTHSLGSPGAPCPWCSEPCPT